MKIYIMPPPGWFYIFIGVFVVIMAVALLLQVLLLGGIWVAFRSLETRVHSLLDAQVHPLLANARSLVDDARKQAERVAGTLEELQESARVQVAKVDAVLSEASDRARLQIIRVDELVADTLGRFERMVEDIERSIVRPIREIHALVVGVRTAVDYMTRRRGRRLPERATQDEEMFI